MKMHSKQINKYLLYIQQIEGIEIGTIEISEHLSSDTWYEKK